MEVPHGDLGSEERYYASLHTAQRPENRICPNT